jgi:hypothetical protein
MKPFLALYVFSKNKKCPKLKEFHFMHGIQGVGVLNDGGKESRGFPAWVSQNMYTILVCLFLLSLFCLWVFSSHELMTWTSNILHNFP